MTGGGVKIVTGSRRNECGGLVQDKSLQLIYLYKLKHPMLVMSRLEPRNSESKWVGVLCEIQNGANFLP